MDIKPSDYINKNRQNIIGTRSNLLNNFNSQANADPSMASTIRSK